MIREIANVLLAISRFSVEMRLVVERDILPDLFKRQLGTDRYSSPPMGPDSSLGLSPYSEWSQVGLSPAKQRGFHVFR
jgi:hypothetical protein